MLNRGVLGLVFWLFVGFAFTEMTALSLNAWLLHESAGHRVATGPGFALEPAATPYSLETAAGATPKAR